MLKAEHCVDPLSGMQFCAEAVEMIVASASSMAAASILAIPPKTAGRRLAPGLEIMVAI